MTRINTESRVTSRAANVTLKGGHVTNCRRVLSSCVSFSVIHAALRSFWAPYCAQQAPTCESESESTFPKLQ